MAQSYTAFILFLTWISDTIALPSSKRAVSIAIINSFSQLGNIAGSCAPFFFFHCPGYVFTTQLADTYSQKPGARLTDIRI